MARLEPLTMEELTPEQKSIYAQVSRNRPRVSGPFGVWLRTPPIAEAANKLVNAVRENGKLEKRHQSDAGRRSHVVSQVYRDLGKDQCREREVQVWRAFGCVAPVDDDRSSRAEHDVVGMQV